MRYEIDGRTATICAVSGAVNLGLLSLITALVLTAGLWGAGQATLEGVLAVWIGVAFAAMAYAQFSGASLMVLGSLVAMALAALVTGETATWKSVGAAGAYYLVVVTGGIIWCWRQNRHR